MYARTGCLLAAVAVLWTALTPFVWAADRPSKASEKAEGVRLEGRVFASDGKTPIQGAVVVALPLQDESEYASTPTDAKGSFELAGLPFGYVDLHVRSADGLFVGNQVINLPPASKVVVEFALTKYAERSPSWWADRGVTGGEGADAAIGVAEVRPSVRGREFWRSPKGVAILASVGGAAILAIAAGGGGSSTSASPSTP